ncbi:MAG: hypothetical protein ACRER3_17370, partial [Pseudomonas fluorescens]
MYQFTSDPDMLLCLETGAWIPRGHPDWPSKWLLSNTPAPVPPPFLPNSPEHHRAIRDAAWAWMAGEVQDRQYDSIETCVGYYNSGVARYREEARAMVAWRDAVNQALEAMVMAPPAGVVTWEQVQALLPQPESFAWPE